MTTLPNAKGITVYEALVTVCLIGALTGMVIVKYYPIFQETRETAVRAELANIRATIRLFKMLNGRNPRSLKEMIEKKVMFSARLGPDEYADPIFLKEKYLAEYAVDREGNIVDAFGNPFLYDSSKGEVRTTTKGYETW